ncbi:hypothetical protein BH20ACI1_BH20ACI1_12880 [soil metagenome]
MKKNNFKFTIFLILVAFQLACGQTKSVSSISNQNAAENELPKNNSNSVSNSGEAKNIDYFAHLKPEHKEVLQNWLKAKTFLRPAVEEIDDSMFDENSYGNKEKFKEHFEGNMNMLRETVGKDGYQYYSKGDFNKDGKEDFAVLLVDNRLKDRVGDWFSLAIFNAPFKKGKSPNYYEENLRGISNSYIIFSDEFSEKPGKYLFLGKFESDYYCATYYPKGNTYRFEDCM